MVKRFSSTLAGLFLCVGASFAQGKISGKVVSQDDGEPVIGASVMVQGTKMGTVTDVNGNFTLNVPAGKKLVVSYIGMTPQTVTMRQGMTIKLASDNKTLNEVVVTGMSNVDRRMFTGATAQVKADDALIGGLGDISRSLEGRVAGVSVQNVSGTFGTAPKIRVRGATSIYGNSKPLWVVDGVVQEDITDISADALSSGDAETLISSAISGLNSDDIESFQILKDGSATSIYGARAMAGVIVVTTKKGRAGQAHINYTGEFTTRMIPSYSQFNILNSQEQMGIYRRWPTRDGSTSPTCSTAATTAFTVTCGTVSTPTTPRQASSSSPTPTRRAMLSCKPRSGETPTGLRSSSPTASCRTTLSA